MKRQKLYLIAAICEAVVSGSVMVSLFDCIEENNKPRIVVAIISLLISLVLFVCFIFLYRKNYKQEQQ